MISFLTPMLGLLKPLLGRENRITRCQHDRGWKRDERVNGQWTGHIDGNGGSVPITLDFSVGGDGRPLELPVENVGTVSEVHLNFSFQESKAIRVMNRPGPIATGWARVVSDVPLTGTSSYQFSPDGEVLREVGVGHCEPSASYTLYVQRQGRFDTALGIANPSDSRAVVHTALRDSLGAPAGAFAIPLGPGEHIAMFFHELVYQIPAGNFEGTLRIFADRPLVVTAIRTMDGIPMSGYPTAGPIR